MQHGIMLTQQRTTHTHNLVFFREQAQSPVLILIPTLKDGRFPTRTAVVSPPLHAVTTVAQEDQFGCTQGRRTQHPQQWISQVVLGSHSMLGYMKDDRVVGKLLISTKISSSNTKLQQARGRNFIPLLEAPRRPQISSLQRFFQPLPYTQVHSFESIKHLVAVRAAIIGLSTM